MVSVTEKRRLFRTVSQLFSRLLKKQISNYLLASDRLAHIAKNIGLKDLVKAEEFPIREKTLEDCLYATIGALAQSSGIIRAHLFINDFIVTQLIGKDINEIWEIKNPMGLLSEELVKRGYASMPKSRLLWSTGAKSPTGAFIVGLFIDEKFFAKGYGETVEIAEEMAARDALRRLYNTGEDSAPLPFGDRAKKHSHMINTIYDALIKKYES